jgi:hypothetical protein
MIYTVEPFSKSQNVMLGYMAMGKTQTSTVAKVWEKPIPHGEPN